MTGPSTWMPDEQRAALEAVVAAAFGGRPVQAADRLTGGASPAALWRLTVEGEAYVLRLDPPRGVIHDAARHMACLRLAADAGLAPKLIYADPASGASVSVFVAASPAHPPLSRVQRLLAGTEAVARLHAGSRFPDHLDYFDALTGLFAAFADSGVLPGALLAGPINSLARLARVYPRDPADHVSSHNDLNPGNILFQGARPWVVDWDSAFAAPRYVDLAALATFQATDDAEADLILPHYLGASPDARQTARFFVMRQANRMFYAAMLLGAANRERATRLTSAQVHGYRLAAIRNDMAALLGYDGRVAFGCAFFNEAAQALDRPNFHAALQAL